MIPTTIGFLSLAALLGLYLLSFVLRNKSTPKGVALAHGALAATGVVLLLVYVVREGPGPIESLVLFLLAATGGLYLLGRDILKGSIPKWVAIAHGLLAIAGYVLLLVFAFG